MPEYTISPSERQRIVDSADKDRPQLFELADQVISHSSERQWDAVLSDATRGILVGRFLARVLTANAEVKGAKTPELVHIANSRFAYNGILIEGLSKPSRGHSRAITNYLRPMGFERALIATDVVDTGRCMRKLGAAVVKANIRPDFAILVSPCEPKELRRKIHAPNGSQVYSVLSGVEPMLAQGAISQGLGVATEYGNAVPQPSIAPWPWIGEVAYEQYDQLADEYIQEKIT